MGLGLALYTRFGGTKIVCSGMGDIYRRFWRHVEMFLEQN